MADRTLTKEVVILSAIEHQHNAAKVSMTMMEEAIQNNDYSASFCFLYDYIRSQGIIHDLEKLAASEGVKGYFGL